ncbi:hypothetical protein E8E13_000327 [Curvularia kusanoi]|uniref:Uncharacterized protein n=1 Tax=Curvularia kusanoi TaxID=90978 RepID=A0A9P4W916_CURKU|nr:hypothetical protein E8E13_000327 [Curvularia kusanoi]
MAVLCFGYRTTLPVTIRDETIKVIQRARKDYKRIPAKNSNTGQAAKLVVRKTASLLSKDVSLPLQATAMGYFFSVFSCSGTFAYLAEYAATLVEDDENVQAFCASALGSMALQYRNDDLSNLARRYYTASLTSVNRDLASPKTVVLDSTLLRILMLSAFEALDLHTSRGPQNWAIHVQGSCRLLVMRGKSQFRTRFGRELFHHASVNILVHSILLGLAVPQDLGHLVEHATACPGDMDSAGTYILALLWQMALLAPRVQISAFQNVLEHVLPLEIQANAFLNELRKLAPFEKINIPHCGDKTTCTYEGYMYLYKNQQIARLYNTARLMQLTLKEWKFAAASGPFPIDSYRQQWIGKKSVGLNEILDDSSSLVSDMLASVPYSLDKLGPEDSTEARYLIWPLTRIASLNVCPPRSKSFISDRLLAIAEKFGLRRAQEAASMLEQGDKTLHW